MPLAAALVWRAAPRPRHRGAAPADAGIESLSPQQAYDRGLNLGLEGRALESLPYLRRAASSPNATWGVHHDYSAALHNASVSSRDRGGGALETANRTSLERVTLLRASLDELEVAERLAETPHDRALVHIRRARSLAEWGLPLEALEEYRTAAALDPTSAEAQRRTERMLAEVARPLGTAAAP